MPMIRLTVPPGSLTEEGRRTVQRDLAAVLLRWEGAPDTAFFRAQAWSYLVELPEGAQTTAEDDAPRFLVEVTVPQGALSERRKAGPGRGRDEDRAGRRRASPDDALRVWVLDARAARGHLGRGRLRHPLRRPGRPREGAARRCVN
jgi:hypothetical protein